ncbi:MAG: hypothetical protein J0M24_07785 [Verrucomicrobia bacterium]|nr:hypothetical protein [Verrucomicrobiota bacterium]
MVDPIPFLVGRKGANLELEQPGIWDRHFIVDRSDAGTFVVIPQPEAVLTRAGHVLTEATPLRNGDILEAGSVRLQFRLRAARQRSLSALETLTWLGLGVLVAGQIALAASW